MLGCGVEQAFPDVSAFESSVLDRVRRGESLVYPDQEADLPRGGLRKRFRFSVSLSPVADGPRQPGGIIAVITDIDEVVACPEPSARGVGQAEKMEAIGDFAGGIAHDFNNLLTGIIGNMEMLGTRLAQGDVASAETYLEGARTAASRAARLTGRLLALSRRQALSPAPVPVAAFLLDVEELIGHAVGADIKVQTRCLNPLLSTYCDSTQLENALLSLAVNARDAMPDGGFLTIEADDMTPEVLCLADAGLVGNPIVLTIADTGIGMSDDVAAHAFDPFFTTKSGGPGTGLGLSMVYGFIKQSGGHIDVTSRPGGGTTIRLFLPRDVSAVLAADSASVWRVDHGERVKTIDC
ncbi:MAG: ATP-binding protein [Acidiphilium sp.]|nr:ATP-binding protein [Acidiphilium sp.]MDD4934466.1 ATP-binding protein [Acidiphilium sp.]